MRSSLLRLDIDGKLRGQHRSRYRTGGTLVLSTRLLGCPATTGSRDGLAQLGHAWSLLYRNDEDDVMNAETDEGTDAVPDEADFRNLCALYGRAWS